MMLKRFLILFLWGLCAGAVNAEVNLALNKSYTILPKPDYKLCTDGLDNVQLTDGKAYGSDWFSKSTVGWNGMATVPEITIDLEKKSAIDQIRVHSIGGGAALVEYPAFIVVLVSEDGENFGFAGLIENNDLPTGRSGPAGKIPHTFVIKGLKTEGRFVKALMRPGRSRHLFLDEIEVIAPAGPTTVRAADKLRQFNDSRQLVSIIENQLQLKEKIATTIETVDQCRSKVGVNFYKGIPSELEQFAANFAQPIYELFSAEKSLGFSKKLGIIRAKIYREIYKKPYVCVPANPTEVLKESDMPISETVQDLELNVELWQGEYESAAINIINCTDKTMSLYVSVSPLTDPGGNSVDSKGMFTVRRGVFVNAACVGSIADALVLQRNHPFVLQPGELTQIWLTIFNPTLTSGNYKGSIAVATVSEGKELPVETVPVNIDVPGIRFPRTITLNSCCWAYPDVAAETKNSLVETMQDLNKHYTNVIVAHGNQNLPFPKKRLVGTKSVIKLDYSDIDRLIQMNNYARTYLFFFNFNWKSKYELFGEWMTPAWKKNFSLWLRNWVEHLKETGIGYDKFAMYPFDETLGDEFYELAGLIKSIDPKIRIYANSFGKGPADFMRFKNLIDIWCLRDVYCIQHPNWLAAIKGFGKEVWTYEAKGPGKANHPYSYYRLLPWRAFKQGQTGAGFWTYVDYYKKQGWDDTGSLYGYYGVIYGSCIQKQVDTLGENIVPSRRWEAWREGIEDYQYLYELQKAIDLVRSSNPLKAREAQQILDAQVDYVLKRPDNCDAVYQARRDITAALLQLAE